MCHGYRSQNARYVENSGFVRLTRIILNVRNLLDFATNVRLSRIILDQPINYYFAGLAGMIPARGLAKWSRPGEEDRKLPACVAWPVVYFSGSVTS